MLPIVINTVHVNTTHIAQRFAHARRPGRGGWLVPVGVSCVLELVLAPPMK
jgi:hypothetical protein